MNCREFQELVSAAVDLQLTESEQGAFKDHSVACSPCRKEFEAEAATKQLIIRRIRRVGTPPELVLSVSEQVRRGQSAGRASGITDFLRKPLVKPAFGFALAFLVIMFLLRGSTGDSSLPQAAFLANDVILQSLKNHRALVEGEIKPQLSSSEPEQLASLFSGITDYSVHVPKMKNCRLIGGVQNEFAGTKIAHIVYAHDSDIVYIYQACWATVRKGEKLSLSDEAKNELNRTGWFSCSEPDGRSVVLWVKGRALCAAVSRMSKEDLVACLTSDEPDKQGW